jgi:hypothetical protein|tara:strand:+ start:581 stop:1126 length:546 start_codon:yes stop_codon:yes gene_type:complete
MKAKDQFQAAKDMAEVAHEGVVRKFGDDEGMPYTVHTQRVAVRAFEIARNYYHHEKLAYEIGAVAQVHDVPEDHSDIGYDMDRVVRDLGFLGWQGWALCYVTKQSRPYDEFILRLVRALEDAATIDQRLAAYAGAIVKYADLEDNSSSATGAMKAKYKLAMYIINDKFKLITHPIPLYRNR